MQEKSWRIVQAERKAREDEHNRTCLNIVAVVLVLKFVETLIRLA